MSKFKKYLASAMLGVTAVSAVAVPTMASSRYTESKTNGCTVRHKEYINDKTGKVYCREVATRYSNGQIYAQRAYSDGQAQYGSGTDWNHINWSPKGYPKTQSGKNVHYLANGSLANKK